MKPTDTGKREICPNCGETCIVWQVENPRSCSGYSFQVEECSCQRKRREETLLKEKELKNHLFKNKCEKFFPFLSVIPDIEEHIFQNFEINEENRRAYEESKKLTFSYWGGVGLTLIGSYGNGKTRLLLTMGYEKYKRGESVIFVKYSDIFERIFASYEPNAAEKKTDLMDCLLNVQNLFIDELGSGNNSKPKEDLFLKILEERHKKRLQTSFSMNPEGEENLGGRVRSRLTEYAKTVINNAPDYRPTALKKRLKKEFNNA